jgi:predicted chitinase
MKSKIITAMAALFFCILLFHASTAQTPPSPSTPVGSPAGASISAALAAPSVAPAASGDSKPVLLSSANVLAILLLCGLMGLVGQGARAAVGLKTMTSSATTAPSQQSEFNAAYLLISLMIGFIAGVLAGLALGLGSLAKIDPSDIKTLLGIAAAGYAGTDFIENSLSIFIRPAASGGSGAALNANVQVTNDHLARLTNAFSSFQASVAPHLGAAIATTTAMPAAPGLTAAFKSCAHLVNTDLWTPALSAAFSKYDLQTNRRMAAAIGQFLIEAGSGFQEVVENLSYSQARIFQIFPKEFPTLASAAPYAHNPEALGNRAYANKNGHGDEASGDGSLFRGRGLIQLTGRNDYAKFGAAIGQTAEQAAEYCETPAGAAMSGCWYLAVNGCLPLADGWEISKITRIVNGPAMLENNQRIAYSNAFLKALGN